MLPSRIFLREHRMWSRALVDSFPLGRLQGTLVDSAPQGRLQGTLGDSSPQGRLQGTFVDSSPQGRANIFLDEVLT